MSAGLWTKATFSDLMDSLCHDRDGFKCDGCKTDDEPWVAKALMRVLRLTLARQGLMTPVETSSAIMGVLAHNRWLYCVQDREACFDLVATILNAVEYFPDGGKHLNLFTAIYHAMHDTRWPYPAHASITVDDLQNGSPSALETLCSEAFGYAWWHLVDAASSISVTELVLATRPELVNFASMHQESALPTLGN